MLLAGPHRSAPSAALPCTTPTAADPLRDGDRQPGGRPAATARPPGHARTRRTTPRRSPDPPPAGVILLYAWSTAKGGSLYGDQLSGRVRQEVKEGVTDIGGGIHLCRVEQLGC